MLAIHEAAHLAASACAPRIYVTANTYVVDFKGREYRVKIEAEGRYIYLVKCGQSYTSLVPLKSRLSIESYLPAVIATVIKRHRAKQTGPFAMHYPGTDRILETRFQALTERWNAWKVLCGDIDLDTGAPEVLEPYVQK